MTIKRFAAAALLCALAACAAPSPQGTGYAPPGAWLGVTLQPDHGASSLPGSTLPCGFPAHAAAHHVATCPVAFNIHVPAIRNPHVPPSNIPGLHPADIDSAYGFPSNGTGMTVAVVDAYDDRQAESDLEKYRSEFGLPPCTTKNGCFEKVNQRGKHGNPRSSKAWSQEAALDIEMVSAVCPQCRILLVEANSASIDDLGAAVDEAVALGARAVSNSYYTEEWPTESSEDVHYNHPGVEITVSSGDKAAAYYPATSPYVTSVGATSLTQNAGSWNEAAWEYGGQGCSLFEPRPAFQPVLCPTRSAVDMAAVGDPRDGVAVFVTQAGGWVVAGGTSVGAPIIAAAYALSGNPAGPAFSYGHPASFHDVLPAGFDLATGLGSPNGVSGL